MEQKFNARLLDWFFTLLYTLRSVKLWAYSFFCFLMMWGMVKFPTHLPLFIESMKWGLGFFFAANVGVKAFKMAKGGIK